MAISLTVRFYGPVQEDGLQGYDLRVAVIAAHEMSPKVFVWQQNVASATDPEANAQADQFIGLADPVDMERYPEDVPDLLNKIPYYRTSEVRLRFRSMTDLLETKDLLNTDLQQLVDALKAAAAVKVMEEIIYA